MNTGEKIEILPVSLLDEQRNTVNDLKWLARSLGLEFGWHYLLDLAWIIYHLGSVKGKHIMDAGAGTGMMQWYLADRGAEVLSVDRSSRADLPLRFRRRFNVVGLRPQRTDLAEADLLGVNELVKKLIGDKRSLSKKIYSLTKELYTALTARTAPGKVILYNHDLKSLPDVADASLDGIVAVSSLEHNKPADLEAVINELMRVIKPGGMLLATLCASSNEDWFHEPSAGWCYSEASLRRIFNLPESTHSNYANYAELFEQLHNCSELRDDLAAFYFHSGDNGMPWGKWAPQYQPVGICKIK